MDFVENWVITQTLGEGAFGEVKLVLNKTTGENVAMKVINSGSETVRREVLKEIAIHKSLRDPHIIRFYGSRYESGIDYIFLEYAPHGELFDKIEPEVGMPSNQARKFMLQLLNGVEYLHSRGIAHRDIKPENILLDENDNLKLSDFGMATVFRSQGKERALERKCGTLLYSAPEVLYRAYAAQPADIWSCGIVLTAMLAGELPWDKADDECVEYKMWLKSEYTHLSPWNRIDTLPLSLLRRILAELPTQRYNIQEIRTHRWFTSQGLQGENRNLKKLLQTDLGDVDEIVHQLSLSQDPHLSRHEVDDIPGIAMFLSQPTSLQNMLLSTQLINTQSASPQDCMQKLVRRMSRFVVNLDKREAVERLTYSLDKLDLNWKATTANQVTVTTVDKRKTQLIFKSNVIIYPNGTLLDFRLSKGCGLEFKKRFILIRAEMKEYIIQNVET